MAKDNAETLRTLGALFAVALSIVALEASSFLSNQAKSLSQESRERAVAASVDAAKGGDLAREALSLSGRASAAVAGLSREVSTLAIRVVTTTPVLLPPTGSQPAPEDFQLYAKNRSRLPMTGMQVNLAVINGLAHAVDNPTDVCANVAPTTFDVVFDRPLPPQGCAVVDLRGQVQDYLQTLSGSCKFPERQYHLPINISATPVMVKNAAAFAESASTTPPTGDQDLLQVRICPAQLRAPAAADLLGASQPPASAVK